MLPIHSVLASGNPILDFLPYIFFGISGLALVVGFIHGYKKGFRLVSWNGLVWILAAMAFFLLVKVFGENNPFAKPFQSLGTATAVFFGELLLAGLCILFALVAYAVCKTLFPQRMVRVLTDEERQLYAMYGIELDDLSADFDDYMQYAPIAQIEPEYRPAPPTTFGRILGGFFSMMNVFAFVIAIVSGILLVIDCTPLKNVATSLYEVKLGSLAVMETSLRLIAKFGLDFLFIGLTVSVSFKGKDRGLLESFRYVLVRWVGFAAIFVAIYLPFSPYATYENGLVGKVTMKCISMMPAKLGGRLGTLAGQCCAILVFLAVVIIARVLVNMLLKLLVRAVRRTNVLHKVDSSVSCIAYIAVGMIVGTLIWAGLYVVDYYNLFSVGQLFSEDATLSRGFFDAMQTHVKPILDGLMGTVKGVLKKIGM